MRPFRGREGRPIESWPSHWAGASGARLLTTMLYALEAGGGRLGLQSMCEAGGMANATLIERL
ncbi:hypothetical protein MMOR_10280 [Mycolicibacterium moriokaense]|uniref:Thiolase C-terminal domain-containing protein n=1 Tax=Mycolicibacterium moriokaense TaxID=39691 RepID=A0AAD1M4D4_9MYCO|nr:hypothetical protein MMOR_10280 [Mycolicibacterium moriokaense]